MAVTESPVTGPKPFVFVLMPFSPEFSDIYTFGIKGAAEDVGAYAERIDEQIFTEGILDRIFNQINKADVIVADMTDRNANVFYEVGYAHALNKVVLLLTQKADDIPFDLKHRQHIVYGGRIADLRTSLAQRYGDLSHVPTWLTADHCRHHPGVGDHAHLASSQAGIRPASHCSGPLSPRAIRVRLSPRSVSPEATCAPRRCNSPLYPLQPSPSSFPQPALAPRNP